MSSLLTIRSLHQAGVTRATGVSADPPVRPPARRNSCAMLGHFASRTHLRDGQRWTARAQQPPGRNSPQRRCTMQQAHGHNTGSSATVDGYRLERPPLPVLCAAMFAAYTPPVRGSTCAMAFSRSAPRRTPAKTSCVAPSVTAASLQAPAHALLGPQT